MFCSECGQELAANSKFCHNCGKQISSNKKSLICQNCGGTMTFNNDDSISFCPYCGSKETITESDYVKVEQIKNKRIENVEYNRNQSNMELEKHKLNYELEKKKIEDRNDMIIGFSGVGVIFLMLIIGIILYAIFC